MAASSARLTAPVPLNTPWALHVFLVGIVMPIFATVAVVSRVVARRMRGADIKVDDWLIFAALPFYYAHSVITLLTSILGGAGHSTSQLANNVLQDHEKLLVTVQIAYAITLGLVKASVCMLLKRIFGVDKRLTKSLHFMLVVIFCWTLMTTLIALAICHPFSYNWNKNQHGHCGSLEAAFAAVASIDIVVDLAILCLPMPRVWKLQMPVVNKIALTCVFALGFFDLTMGVLRIVYDVRVNFKGDWTDTVAPLYFWSSMEPGVAIMCACAPVLRPIFDKAIPKHISPWTWMKPAPPCKNNQRQLDVGKENATLGFKSYGFTESTVMSGSGTPRTEKTGTSAFASVVSETEVSAEPLTPAYFRATDPSLSVISMRRDISVKEERSGCSNERNE